ncbi:ABC transporter permease [Escherichia coli]|nr:ABC transporter permease [Escherichia coli]
MLRRRSCAASTFVGCAFLSLPFRGLLAAVTGILLAARLGSGNAGAANGLEFDVIAAVVVGGTALSGGRGSLFGTLLGVLVITLIGNGLVLLGINSFFQQVVRGVIIVVAVLANILLTQRSSKAKRYTLTPLARVRQG